MIQQKAKGFQKIFYSKTTKVPSVGKEIESGFAYICLGDKYGLNFEKGWVDMSKENPTLLTKPEAYFIANGLQEENDCINVKDTGYGTVRNTYSMMVTAGFLFLFSMILLTIKLILSMAGT